jgi:Tfp pilus assembly protein PilZ
MERRGSSRLDVNDETSIFATDGLYTAILENISAGGLFIRTNKPVEIGEMLEITIPLPDNPEKNKITVNVIAVRIMNNGVAFKFQNLDDNAQSVLLHLTSSAHA